MFPCLSVLSLLLAAPPAEIVDGLAKPFVEEHPHAGLVVGILTPEGPRVFGYGEVELDGNTVTPGGDTVFEIGSVSKSFTGVLFADLVCAGTVHPDDPVKKHLPAEWELPRRDDRDIRLIHLTTHTSGLPVQPPSLPIFALVNDPKNPYAKYRVENLRKTLSALELQRPIGSKHEYSNLGTGLLGEALYRAANAESYEQLLIDRIANPLGMADTRIALSESQRKRLAPPHDERGEPTSPWEFGCLHGCGAVRSTAGDMLIYLKANIDAGESFAMSHQPWRETVADRQSIGFGWYREEKRAGKPLLIWHNGGTGGYASFIGFVPDSGYAVVVMTNTPAREVDTIGMKLLSELPAKED